MGLNFFAVQAVRQRSALFLLLLKLSLLEAVGDIEDRVREAILHALHILQANRLPLTSRVVPAMISEC